MGQKKEVDFERSLAYTPTWSIATVTTILVALGFLAQRLLRAFRNRLSKTKRWAILEALEKIKEELMVFGIISLLLGQWNKSVAEICVSSSVFNSRFYMCAVDDLERSRITSTRLLMDARMQSLKYSFTESWNRRKLAQHSGCPEGLEPFVSHESLLQLHHFLFVLGITHVIYCSTSVALAMVKIYSWSSWEDHARNGSDENSNGVEKNNMVFCRHSTFVLHHASHPWSKNKVLIWMLCFFRQFWSSVNKSDYLALRLGFIMKHNLPLAYNFHSYILRSMEDEFRDIVGLSLFLWGYAVLCIFLNFHGTNMFFWLSFAPAILILLVGTKLHHIVVQLALETMTSHSGIIETQPRPRDELFWFRKPKLLLWLIQFISFQNAFEMATFIWSLWEIRSSSCFMKNRSFLVTRLASGILVQFWSSFGVFPLYVIVTQMGSKCKKALISENVRESLHGWRKRVKNKTRKHHTDSPFGRMRSITSFKTVVEEMHPSERSLPSARNLGQEHEAVLSFDDNLSFDEPIYDTYSDEEDEDDEICLLSPT